MKDKSFVLRSSRITSKTLSTISPAYLQSVQAYSPFNDYFRSVSSIHNVSSQKQLQQQLSQKDKQLKERLSKLTNNLKHIERQYKQNLKAGFQNKINSYRLQAVMERKMFKQTIDQTLRLNQLQQIKEKYQMAVKRKQFSEFKTLKLQQLRQKQQRRLKDQSLQERRKIDHQISARTRELASKNKLLHDKIISEQKYKDRKKNYLEYWKQQKLKKDQFEQKKQFLEKIVMNSKKIKGLKEELQNVQQRFEKLLGDKEVFSKDKSSVFVTI